MLAERWELVHPSTEQPLSPARSVPFHKLGLHRGGHCGVDFCVGHDLIFSLVHPVLEFQDGGSVVLPCLRANCSELHMRAASSCRRRTASSDRVLWQRRTVSVLFSVVASLGASCACIQRMSLSHRETCMASFQAFLRGQRRRPGRRGLLLRGPFCIQ